VLLSSSDLASFLVSFWFDSMQKVFARGWMLNLCCCVRARLLDPCSVACRILREMVMRHGDRKWALISQSLPGRVGKQCRERWTNHLRPDLKVHILFLDRSIHRSVLVSFDFLDR
jgi:hypothetical protein